MKDNDQEFIVKIGHENHSFVEEQIEICTNTLKSRGRLVVSSVVYYLFYIFTKYKHMGVRKSLHICMESNTKQKDKH